MFNFLIENHQKFIKNSYMLESVPVYFVKKVIGHWNTHLSNATYIYLNVLRIH